MYKWNRGNIAVGKTAASIGLAKAIGGEIISADSMQVYREMDIGSAKIRPEEMDGVPHHLVDAFKSTLEEAKYAEEKETAVEETKTAELEDKTEELKDKTGKF